MSQKCQLRLTRQNIPHHGRGAERGPLAAVCVIPFIKRAERGRHTPHNYESTPVEPLRHVGIVSTTEA